MQLCDTMPDEAVRVKAIGELGSLGQYPGSIDANRV